jgi:hypothetical protein
VEIVKYLKTYKIFESVPWGRGKGIYQYASRNKEIRRTCDDILLDLTDDGYFVGFLFDLDDDNNWGLSLSDIVTVIQITIRKDKDLFLMEEVEPVVDRLISYLKSEGFSKTFNSSGRTSSSAGPLKDFSYEIHFKEE